MKAVTPFKSVARSMSKVKSTTKSKLQKVHSRKCRNSRRVSYQPASVEDCEDESPEYDSYTDTSSECSILPESFDVTQISIIDEVSPIRTDGTCTALVVAPRVEMAQLQALFPVLSDWYKCKLLEKSEKFASALTSIQEERDSLAEELESLAKDNTELEDDYQTLKISNELLQNDIAELESDVTSAKEITSLKTQFSRLHTTLDREVEEHATTSFQLAKYKKRYNGGKKFFEEEKTRTSQTISEYQNALNTVHQNYTTLQNSTQSVVQQRDILASSLHLSNLKNQNTERQRAAWEEYGKQTNIGLETSKADYERVRGQVEDLVFELHEANTTAESWSAKYNKDVEMQKNALQSQRQTISVQADMIEDLKARIENASKSSITTSSEQQTPESYKATQTGDETENSSTETTSTTSKEQASPSFIFGTSTASQTPESHADESNSVKDDNTFESVDQNSFPFGSGTPTPSANNFEFDTSSSTANTFNFGAASTATNSFRFGASPPATSNFEFGAAPSTATTFDFGAAPTATNTFRFGVSQPAANTFEKAKKSRFDFGSPVAANTFAESPRVVEFTFGDNLGAADVLPSEDFSISNPSAQPSSPPSFVFHPMSAEDSSAFDSFGRSTHDEASAKAPPSPTFSFCGKNISTAADDTADQLGGFKFGRTTGSSGSSPGESGSVKWSWGTVADDATPADFNFGATTTSFSAPPSEETSKLFFSKEQNNDFSFGAMNNENPFAAFSSSLNDTKNSSTPTIETEDAQQGLHANTNIPLMFGTHKVELPAVSDENDELSAVEAKDDDYDTTITDASVQHTPPRRKTKRVAVAAKVVGGVRRKVRGRKSA